MSKVRSTLTALKDGALRPASELGASRFDIGYLLGKGYIRPSPAVYAITDAGLAHLAKLPKTRDEYLAIERERKEKKRREAGIKPRAAYKARVKSTRDPEDRSSYMADKAEAALIGARSQPNSVFALGGIHG